MSLPIYHFDLCITPNVKTPPVLNLGQYDNSRPFMAHLKKENGETFYLNSNATAVLEGVTSESEIFQILATVEEQGSAISFIPDNISTSTSGRIYVTLQIRENNKRFAPLYMILNVQAAGVSENQKINNQVFKDAVEEAFQDYISTHDSEGAVIPHVDVTGDCAVINITSNGCFYNNQPINGEGIQELVDQKSAVFAYYDNTMFMYSKPIEENGVSYQSFTRIEDGLLQQVLVPFNNNLIQYKIQPINGLLSISGKNLVDSYNAADKSASSRINVNCNGEKASLFYRFENEEQRAAQDDKTGYSTDQALTTFRINLAAPLLEGHKYVLSFTCKNVYDNVLNNQYFPKFIIYNNIPKWVIQDEDSDGYKENALVYDCNINEKVYRSNVDGNKSLLESLDSDWTLIADKSQQQEQQNYVELMAVSEPFSLYEGRVFVILTPKTTIKNFIRFKEIRNSGDHSQFIVPNSKIQIDIFDIQIEEGTLSSNYQPAALTTFEKAKDADDLTHTYIEQASETGWSTAELEHAHAIATMVKTIKDAKFMTAVEKASLFTNVDKRDNFRITKPLYVPLPFPMRFTALVGSTDRPAPVHICSVDSLGGRGAVGVKYRFTSPYYDDGADVPPTVIRLIINERFHDVPSDPEIPYDSSIANQIISIGRSYVNSVANGRQYSYGENFFYSERPDNPRTSNGLINDSLGRGKMECDTFVGLVLRGIQYEDSPYNPNGSNSHVSGGWKFVEGTPSGWEFNENSGWQYVQGTMSKWLSGQTGNDTVTRIVGNGKTGYQQLMEDTASLVTSIPWAQQLRAKMADTVVHECYNRDAKYACDLAWMFWWISKTITNPENEWELLPNGTSTQPLAEYNTLDELYDNIGSYSVDDVCKADGWYYILTTKPNSKTIGCIFSNPEKARPGDIMFARNENEGRWFDNISHVAIVTQAADADGYLTIMEATTARNSAGRVVQEVNMRYRSTKPAYFARPYGWY